MEMESKENKYFIEQDLKDTEVFYCRDFFSHISDELYNLGNISS